MNKNIYVKKYWIDENITFYIHFQNGEAVKQIEVSSTHRVFLTVTHSIQGESMLFDQSLESLDLEKRDFITEQEFNSIWDIRI